MSNLKIFENPEFGKVRATLIDNKPYFVGSDVARILGYAIPHKAVRDHCKGVLKQNILTSGGYQEMLVIPPGDVYRLIAKSRLPIGEKFESWLFDEVVPSIFENGGYIMGQENMTPEEIVANALIVANRIIDNKNKQIEEMKPKVEYYDTVTQSEDVVDIKQAAKILNLGYGRNTLFKKLRELKILDQYNLPYQKYIDRGYFRVVQVAKEVKGKVRIYPKTVVYQKGLDFIRKVVGNYDRNLPQKRMA